MKILIKEEIESYVSADLIGEFDALGCKDIRHDLECLLERNRTGEIYLDLSNVTFMDSSGVGALVFMLKRLKANGGSLSLHNVCGQPQELLTLLRVDQAIPVEYRDQAC